MPIKTEEPDYSAYPSLDISDLSGLNDRDFASLLLPTLDYDSQLEAIEDLLKSHQRAEHITSREISQLDEIARRTTGTQNSRAVDEWLERMHGSIYQDAAHSMAAAGMLAPLMESIFYQAFLEIGAIYEKSTATLPTHPRWQQSAVKRWDCHCVWITPGKWDKDICKGVMQLTEEIGLASRLPSELGKTLEALFAYRNKMFHHGFEWPIDERQKFENRIHNSGWPADWFHCATRGGNPWIYYLTNSFISGCISTIRRVIQALGEFARYDLDHPTT